MNPLEFSPEGFAPLFAAYVKAQSCMGDVFKTAKNPAFKSNYADLAAVVDAVVPAFNKAGLAVIQSPSFDGDLVTVETMVAHGEGGWMRSVLSLRPTKTDPQGVGSAITYGRRYGLMAIAGVAPEDDDGNAASAGAPRSKPVAASAFVTASKNAIDKLATSDACGAWWKDNKQVLSEADDDERNLIVAYLKARKELLLAEFPGDAVRQAP